MSRWGPRGEKHQATEQALEEQDEISLALQTEKKAAALANEMEQSDVVTEKVGLNHVIAPKRNLLTKRSTQREIERQTGALLQSRGKYRPPDADFDNTDEEPIHILVTGASESIVHAAVALIRQIISSDETADRRYSQEISLDKLPGIDHPFRVVGRLVGPGGQYIKHIKRTSNCEVNLWGVGCGSPDRDNGKPLHLVIQAHTKDSMEKAAKLCNDLIDTVVYQYEQYLLENPDAIDHRKQRHFKMNAGIVYKRPPAPPPPLEKPVKRRLGRKPPAPPNKPY